jgi:hypothetical protein
VREGIDVVATIEIEGDARDLLALLLRRELRRDRDAHRFGKP